MRPILFVVSALAVLCAADAFAKPPKKAAPPPAKKAVPTMPMGSSPAPETPAASASSDSSGPAVRGPTRIDFDDRLIQGQSNKSGAVYLYDRKELKIRSMIKKRENFRDEIVGSLYDT